jgi:hypothetical protein
LVTFRHGWNPTPPELPRPRFDTALRAVVPPASADFYSRVPVVGLHLNDQWGDCTCACDANLVQGITFYGQGTETVVPDQVVEQAYEQSGFNPNAGPPGSNPTDQGWLVSSALALLKNTGMCGCQIAAYGQLASLADHSQVMVCAAEFGYMSLGLTVYQADMDQFNAGQTWDAAGNAGPLLGGHCICLCGYNSLGPVAWTWGRAQQMTWAFWDARVQEAWPVVSRDWVNAATGTDPEGVDLAVLGTEFQAVTGQNPFPAPVPAPPAPFPPPPQPSPVPPQPVPPAPPVHHRKKHCGLGSLLDRVLRR